MESIDHGTKSGLFTRTLKFTLITGTGTTDLPSMQLHNDDEIVITSGLADKVTAYNVTPMSYLVDIVVAHISLSP